MTSIFKKSASEGVYSVDNLPSLSSLKLDFSKLDGLISAVVVSASDGTVLMNGFMNEKAVEKTFETGLVTFFSRTKQRLWQKGETSGNVLRLVDFAVDCDRDSLLIRVKEAGPVCHLGKRSCFLPSDELAGPEFLLYLESVMKERSQNDSSSKNSREGGELESYTAKLLARPTNKVAQKFGEEAVETVIAACSETDERFISESADLLYHLLALFIKRGLSIEDLMMELNKRHVEKVGQ